MNWSTENSPIDLDILNQSVVTSPIDLENPNWSAEKVSQIGSHSDMFDSEKGCLIIIKIISGQTSEGENQAKKTQ